MNLQGSITGFYYIGADRDNISKLVNIYKRGYASGNLEQAMMELGRENQIIPEVIICESLFGFQSIQTFSDFLRKHENLSRIPFIIDADSLTATDNYHFICNEVVDDFIKLEEWEENSLSAKIRFLHKYKARTLELKNRRVESLSAQIPETVDSFLKRSFDILVSMAALIFLSPVFMTIAIAIRLESEGTIFYISKRAGKGYRIFNFYKFRTMYAGADQQRTAFAHLNQYHHEGTIPFFKINNDPRITRVGRFLRNCSLDELPQLFNVLLGDMSLVGNRPLPLYEAENLTTDLLAKRFLAPAGITGLWQIKKRGKSEMSVDERIGLDIDYANKSNFLYDLWIMANTPQALMQKANT